MNRAIVLSHRAVAHELGNIGTWFELRDYEVTHVYREDITEDSLVSLDHVEGDK